jgi:uncharacterized protein (TIGR02118 family)
MSMYKLAGFLRFLPELDKADTRRYWEHEHGPLVAKIPGLLRYVQSDLVESLQRDESDGQTPPPFDGYVAHWYESKDALQKAMGSPEWSSVMEDGARIVDTENSVMGPVEERILKDGPTGSVKTIGIAHFPSAMDKRAAGDYWTNVHGPLTLKVGGFLRYVQNHTITDPDWNLPFDGFAEHWFTDEASHRAAFASEGWRELEKDGPNFLDTERFWGAVVTERSWRDGHLEAAS